MLLALPDLARVGYKVNARGCRQFSEGLGVLRGRAPPAPAAAPGRDRARRRRVGHPPARSPRRCKIVGPKRILGLVTPRELGGGRVERRRTWSATRASATRKHVKVLDWVKYSAGHSSWFQPDGLHLTFSGAKAFARLLKKLIPLATSDQAKKPARESCPSRASGSA